ncbi:MAG: MoaD/ThiS family protein [Microbacteriaceae bacterium]
MRIHLRYFAAAEAALGRPEEDLDVPVGATIQSVLSRLVPAELAMASLDQSRRPRVDQAHIAQVLGRCSFLVNGVATGDRERVLHADDKIDVLPPFAGG